MVSEATRSSLGWHKFLKFPGGTYPRPTWHEYVTVCYDFVPLMKNLVQSHTNIIVVIV